MNRKVGIIGFGNMGSAIGKRINASVSVFDIDKPKTDNLQGNIEVAATAASVVEKSDIIILAVKPQDLDSVCQSIKDKVTGTNKLLISIAAGITTVYIERSLGQIRVIRAMPNIGAKIGKSVTCICKGSFATDEDLGIAQEIFSSIGEVHRLNEDMMNAATAISGSGPAYYFRAIEVNPEAYKSKHKEFHEEFISSLSKAARDIGFDEKTAGFLARWTIIYSDLLLKETKIKPEDLRKQVTSKGGTTEAALEILFNGGSLVDAVKAAVERAKKISRG
jgi:pyrroline-5-carboxylate reductase